MTLSLRNIRVPRRAAIAGTAAGILAAAAYAYVLVSRMPPPFLPGYPGDAFFPTLVLVMIAFFGVIVLLKALFSSREPDVPSGEPAGPVQIDIVETLIVAGLGIAFIQLLFPLGLEIALFMLMFALLFPRLLMPWPMAAMWASVGALCTLAVIYLGFVIGLKVFLPLKFLPTNPF